MAAMTTRLRVSANPVRISCTRGHRRSAARSGCDRVGITARAQMSVPPRYSGGALPTELWIGVARYVTRGRDVVALAGTSRLFRQIATRRANVRQVVRAWAQSDRIGDDWLELIEYARHLDDKGVVGATAPHYMAYRGHEAIGATGLQYMVYGGHEAVVAALMAAGADVNAKDKLGRTALHYAAFGGYEAIVAALIAAGADVNAKNENGETLLYLAARECHATITAALRAAGATE